MAFGEDSNRTASGHAGANLGLIRRAAASLLQQDPGKGSIKAKRLNAALDESYMLRALRGFPAN
ncbi:MAG: Transposase domain protein [Planctomycetota bacterium]|nr:Transposase domain protein [Planctomycetota bacterium]